MARDGEWVGIVSNSYQSRYRETSVPCLLVCQRGTRAHYSLPSSQWTIASFLQTNVAITDIPPTATIYKVRTFIRQHHEIISPRDGKFYKPFYFVHIVGEGQVEVGSRFPSPKAKALWRGKAAGGAGTDGDAFFSEQKGRISNDESLRPSTPSL